MSYAQIEDVFARYSPVETMVGGGIRDVSSAEVSSVYIADGESMVDLHMNQRYVVPLNPVEPVITQVTADLAIFNMLAERLPKVPDYMQARYDRSMRLLRDIRDGKMSLNSGTALSGTGDEEVWSTNEDYHSVFSPVLDPDCQAVDTDQVNADRDERATDAGGCGTCGQTPCSC